MRLTMITIRFGYCPPNPGPNASTGCRWYSDIDDAIDAYYNYRIDQRVPIYISINNSKYVQISYNELLELKTNFK